MTIGKSGIARLGVIGALVGACAAETENEPVGKEAEEGTTRCTGTTASTTEKVKVMTINLRHNRDQWGRRFELIADELNRLDPDIIGLQEVDADQADKLNALMARRGHAKYHLYTKRKPGLIGFFTGEGIGIMSRWPITEQHFEHTAERRVSILARIKHPWGGYIDIINTHLHARRGADGDAIRDDQAKQTLDLVKRNDDCFPTFLTGDMNAKEDSPALKRFKAGGFVDSYPAVHGDATATTGNTARIKLAEGAEQNPKNRIDFVMGRSAGGRTVKPLDSIVCFKNHDAKGFYPSDHLGVITTYEVKM